MSRKNDRHGHAFWRDWLWWLVAIPLVLLAVYVVAMRQFMAVLPEYRTQLETLVAERFGTDIKIDRLEGEMEGLSPRIRLFGLSLPAVEGGSPLTLDRVDVSVRVLASLLTREPRLNELRVEGVDLHLVRDEQGRIHLRGLEAFEGGEPQWDRWLSLLYHQYRIVIDDARFSLKWPDLPPLASSLRLALVNHGDQHRLAVKLEARDRPFSVDGRLRLDGNPLRWEQVNAGAYLSLDGERLEEWLPDTREWPLDLQNLQGKTQLWLEVRDGRPTSGSARLSAPRLVLTDGETPWAISDLNLDARFRYDPRQGGEVVLSKVRGETPAGDLAPGPLAASWREPGEGQARSWAARGERLRLQALARQLAQWPFAWPASISPLRQKLEAFQPQGQLRSLYLTGEGTAWRSLQARFSGLQVRAVDKLPGVSGLNGWLTATPEGGLADLRGDTVGLMLPEFYDHALEAAFTGALRWSLEDQSWTLDSGAIRARNPDARGVAMARVRGGAEQIPELRLLADLFDGDGARASHYIPLGRLPDGLGDWLGQAFRGGHLDHGQFLYQGPVKIDRQRQQDRTFQMRYQARDVALSFLPDWPVATAADAEVLVDGRRLVATAGSGTLLNSQISQVAVDIPEQGGQLVVQGKVSGPAADVDRIFHDTPLAATLPKELLDWRFREGQVQGHLLLDVPLKKGEGRQVTVVADGSASGVTVANEARRLTLTGVTSPVHFHSRNGLNLPDLKGEGLGGRFSGAWTTRDADSRLVLTGGLPAARLRQWLGFDWLSPVSGTVPVDITMSMPWRGRGFHLEASSSLRGVAVNAPAPLGKSADSSRRLWLSLDPERQDLRVEYAGVGRGRIRIGDPVAGVIRLGEGDLPNMPSRGVTFLGHVDRADANAWMEFIGSLAGGGAGGGQNALVNRAVFNVGELTLAGQRFRQVRFSAMPAGSGWELGLLGGQVAASLQVPGGFQARGQRPLLLTVSRLYLPEGATGGSDGGAGKAPIAPSTLPPLDATISDLRLGGQQLGDWSGNLRPVDGGVHISGLRGGWRRVGVDGALTWTGDDRAQHTRFQGILTSDDLGKALSAWGLPPLVESKDARASLNLSWNGWPLAPPLLGLQGQVNVDIGECRIPDTDSRTSILRVLGVFNIGTLQRRLRLDFSDLYKKGLSCDALKGDFQFQGPRVSTQNLHIDSPSAAFQVSGQVNLAEQTLNNRVAMTLPISSNLYAGCLAGPAVCAGVFVVERLWGDKLDKTTTMQYQVSGPWKEPRVTEAE